MFTENQEKMFNTFQACLNSSSNDNSSLKNNLSLNKKTKVKSHPTFEVMITRAIKAENNPEGSTLCYIKKYLECNYNVPPTSHHITKTLIRLSLPSKNVLIPSLDKNGNIYHKYTLNPEYKSCDNKKSIRHKVQKPVEPGLEMRGKRWSKEEDELLISKVGCDYTSLTEIAILHKRTEIGIIFRVMHLLCDENTAGLLEKSGYVLEEFIEWARKRLAVLGCNDEKISRLRRSNSGDKGDDAKVKPTQGGNLYIIDRKNANFPTLVGDFCYSEGQKYGLPKWESEDDDITKKSVIPKGFILKKRVVEPSTNDLLRNKNIYVSTDSSSVDEDDYSYSGEEESESVD